MRFVRALITNHPLANIAFVVVISMGLLAYAHMPREQDPEINFNWVSIVTALPGSSAEEVERLVTNPLEDGIKGVADVRFVISTSRENISTILVRFREISERNFGRDRRYPVTNRFREATLSLPKAPAVAAPRGMRRENLFLRRAVNADAPSVRLGRPGSSLRSRRLFSGRWRWLPGGSRRAGHDVEPGASSAEQNAR